MAAVGLIIAVPVTIAVRGDEGEPEGPPVSAAPETPALGQMEFDRELGVALRVPDGWRRKRKDGLMTFRSPDRAVLIAISAPGPDEDVEAIHEQAIASIRAQYDHADVVERIEDRELGGRPATTAAIAARNPKSREALRILVSTARGEKRAYLVEVFAAGSNPVRAELEAQSLLAGLELEG